MAITVKQLIKQLEAIDNKYLEVEVCLVMDGHKTLPLDAAKRSNMKVLLFTEGKKC